MGLVFISFKGIYFRGLVYRSIVTQTCAPQASIISILKKETLYWLHVTELFTYLKHFWNCEVKNPVYELLISVVKWKENSICCDWSQFIDLLCEFFIKVKFLNKKRNLLFNSFMTEAVII